MSAISVLNPEGKVLPPGGACISHDGGSFPAPAELRDKVCLLDSHVLLIAAGEGMNHGVLAYEDQLARKGFATTRHLVTMAEIRQRYLETSPMADVMSDMSAKQGEVIKLIKTAIQMDASDMHFIVSKGVSLLRFRVNGELQTHRDLPEQEASLMCSTIYQSMCDVTSDPIYDRNKPQDGRIKGEFLEAAGLFGVRVATRPTDRGQLMVLRLLYNRSSKKRQLGELGYLPQQVAAMQRMTRRKNGVNIFAGETGSGKSSSLEVAIRDLISAFAGQINVLTIEDPPEYRIDGAVQTPKGGGTWADAIRNAMRLDPDVLMVGEVRDFESAEVALQGALTGHGLWTTVHANDAVAILQRLQDFRHGAQRLDPSLYTDPSLVTGLINQALAPVLCPGCKRPWATSKQNYERDLVERVERLCTPDTVFCTGPGCEKCGKSGVIGRTVIAEVIIPNYAFMRTFRNEGKAEARAYWLTKMEGVSKAKHLIQRINEGLIDPAKGEQKVGLLDDDELALEAKA